MFRIIVMMIFAVTILHSGIAISLDNKDLPADPLPGHLDTEDYKKAISDTDLPNNLFSGLQEDDLVYGWLKRLLGKPVDVAYQIFFEGKPSNQVNSNEPTTVLVLFLRIMLYLSLMVLCVYIFYILFAGLIKTGTSGKFLGEKWDSFWLPLRVAGSITSIIPIPAFGGLGSIQMLVLGCTLLGVSVASVTYVFVATHAMKAPLIQPEYSASKGFVKQLLESQICAALIQQESTEGSTDYRRNHEINQINDVNSDQYIESFLKISDYQKTVANRRGRMGSSHVKNTLSRKRLEVGFEGRCGYVEMNSGTESAGYGVDSFATPREYRNLAMRIHNNRDVALKNLYKELYAYVTKPLLFGEMNYDALAKNFDTTVIRFDNELRKDIDSSLGVILEKEHEAFFRSIETGGFGMAGVHYWLVEHMQDRVNRFYDVRFPAMQIGLKDETSARRASRSRGGRQRTPPNEIKGQYINSNEFLSDYQAGLKGSDKIYSFSEENDPISRMAKAAGSNTNQFLVGIEQFVAKAMIKSVRVLSTGSATNYNIDPLLEIRNLGQMLNNLLISGMGIYLSSVFFTNQFEASAAGKVTKFFTGGSRGASAVLDVAAPMLASAFGSLALIGLFLGTIIPMMPYVIFTLGVIGYLIYVMESLAGAPIWAALHADPDGHELFGRGGAGYAVLLTLTLRPTLMLGGYFLGMAIFRILATWINQSLFITHEAMAEGGFDILSSVGLLVIYTALQVANAYKCFGLTSAFPNAVLRWLGVNDHADLGEREGHDKTLIVAQNVGSQISTSVSSTLDKKK